MVDFQNNVFANFASIPPDSQVIFVADMFAEDYVGGAELTSQALIDSSPFKVFNLKSKQVTMDLLRSGADKFWIFGNFTELNPDLIPSIVANIKYSVLEYDYKYCRFRSPERHMSQTGMPCDCHNQINGKLISAFLYGAMGTWWMSEKQRERYVMFFPFLTEKDSVILSSVFDAKTLGYIKSLVNKHQSTPKTGWIVLGSTSWIKGADAAKKWCEDNNHSYEVVWNMSYATLLEKLATAEGFVYLPVGGDTCPRMVIEAKLLGCKLHINENVQHKDEEWFATDDLQSINDHLYSSCTLFWSGIKTMMDYKPSISGYTTTYNCATQDYPFIQCIKSMLEFCDEVCIADGGSTDVTFEDLLHLAYNHVFSLLQSEDARCFRSLDFIAKGYYEFPDEIFGIKKDPRIKVKMFNRDWKHPRFAVFDGMQKAEARAMCTSEFCWQMDSDEVVHEDDVKKIFDLCRSMPQEANVVSLPVIEYWGGPEKARLDVQPWKWRLSRNHPDITHGIPKQLRKTDADGNLCALEGTDGCDMISKETGEPLHHISFYSADVEVVRLQAMSGDVSAKQQYEQWYNMVTTGLPSVFHYSWFDLVRKIKLYKNYWTAHWNSLYDKHVEDTSENNMMFDVPWSQVTEEMIVTRAEEMKTQLGGWIWHKKWRGESTPYIKSNRTQPKVMR